MITQRIRIVSLFVGMMLLFGISVTDVQAAVEKSLDRGVEVIAQDIAEPLPQDKKPLLAVLDFNDLSDCVSALGRLTAEKLVTKLFKTKRVRVVERGLLKKALEELKFNLSELIDPNRAKQLGKQVGADAIVSGTITDTVSSVEIIARAIAVETGDVLATAEVEIAKDESIKQLVSQPLSCPKGQKEPAMVVGGPPPPKGGKELKFEDQVIRVTVRSLKKQDKSITLVVIYETILAQPVNIYFQDKGTYLLDENGNKWDWQSDTATLPNMHYGPQSTLSPNSKLTNKITFKATATGETNGRLFSLVNRLSFGGAANGEGVVTINDIPAE